MPIMDLAGKYVVVTGGSSGLGRAMSKALLEAGASVAVASRPGHRLERAVAHFKRAGLDAVALPTDVRVPAAIERARDWVLEHWPHCDMVVNNAGIGMLTVNRRFLTDPQPFFHVSPERFDDFVRTNLTGYFLVSRAFSELFIHQGFGRFVNVTMNHATMTRRGFVPYGPSRAATESLSRIMAEDLKPYGITVNMLAPGGATLTGMIPDAAPQEVRTRLIDAEVMGPPIVFLASDAAEGVTGERIEAIRWEEWRQAKNL